MLALRKTVVSSRDRGFSKLSRSHHQSGVQSCCWLSVSSLICVNWLVGHATFLLTISLKWHNSIGIGQFQTINNVRSLTNSLSSFWCYCQPGRGNHNTEYESDLCNKEHHYRSKKKKRPIWYLNSWPLWYQCSPLPTELTNITARGTLVLSCFLQPHHVSFCRMADICSKYFDLLEHQVVGEKRLSFFSASLGDATRQPRQLICLDCICLMWMKWSFHFGSF